MWARNDPKTVLMYKQKYVKYSLISIMCCEKNNNKTETAEERPSYR